MNFFDIILVQPIFNVLLFIYGIVPGHDFGVALILFTVLIRFVMWPLVRKQLHQTKIMQALQPDIKKIKERTKGNRQQEAQLMMELYKERGVNPFGSIGLLIVQLPVFIALYAVVQLMTANHGAKIGLYAYGFIAQLPYIKEVIAQPDHLNTSLFGVIDLTRVAVSSAGVYLPIFVLAILAGIFQFVQSRQLLPKVKEGRKLRDILKEQSAGKQVDQTEMSALMTSRMAYMFPVLTFIISIYIAGALVLYLLTTSIVAVIQQRLVLQKDSEEMEGPPPQATKAASKLKNAQEAEIVSTADIPAKKHPLQGKSKRKKA